MSLPLDNGHDWPFAALWNNGHGLVGHFYTNNNILIQNNVQEKNDYSHGQRE